jgi:hypothetical protein
MTVDQATGKLFVFDYDVPIGEYVGQSSLVRFPPDANGNAAPFARTAAGFQSGGDSEPAVELASDSTGLNIISGHGAACCNATVAGVSVMAKQFPNNSATENVASIFGFPNRGVADDPTTKTYLVTTYLGIVRFAEHTNGHGAIETEPAKYTPPIVSTITSASECGQVVLGYLRNIYAVCGTNTIDVYTHDASGSATPLRVLSGAATRLDQPYGLYEGK